MLDAPSSASQRAELSCRRRSLARLADSSPRAGVCATDPTYAATGRTSHMRPRVSVALQHGETSTTRTLTRPACDPRVVEEADHEPFHHLLRAQHPRPAGALRPSRMQPPRPAPRRREGTWPAYYSGAGPMPPDPGRRRGCPRSRSSSVAGIGLPSEQAGVVALHPRRVFRCLRSAPACPETGCHDLGLMITGLLDELLHQGVHEGSRPLSPSARNRHRRTLQTGTVLRATEGGPSPSSTFPRVTRAARTGRSRD